MTRKRAGEHWQPLFILCLLASACSVLPVALDDKSCPCGPGSRCNTTLNRCESMSEDASYADAGIDSAAADAANDASGPDVSIVDAADDAIGDSSIEDSSISDASLDAAHDSSVVDSAVDAATPLVPVFPGALGFGTDTPGGRGGRLIQVTNLNASGTGSFAEAVQASGPRVVVFRVGGVIDLPSTLMITEPYLTVAGQTAIGNGIVLRGAGLHIGTHDVVLRGLRIRTGNGASGEIPRFRNAFVIHLANNIVIDHCSFEWNLTNAYLGTASNVTFSWNVFAESLACSSGTDARCSDDLSSAGYIYNKSVALQSSDQLGRASLHHNLFAHNSASNPEFLGGTVEFVQNIVYDWGYRGTRGETGLWHWLGNQYIVGTLTRSYNGGTLDSAAVFSPTVSLYAANNALTDSSANFANFVVHTGPRLPTPQTSNTSTLTATYQRLSQAAVAAEWTRTLGGGRLGAQPQDETDQRILTSVANRTGTWRSQEVASEWNRFSSVLTGAPPDTDRDGMPDAWEALHGVNPVGQDGNADRDGDGYTNVEEYLNSLLPAP